MLFVSKVFVALHAGVAFRFLLGKPNFLQEHNTNLNLLNHLTGGWSAQSDGAGRHETVWLSFRGYG